ncbi:cytochrome P450 [Westerdykella ornata]|uniref:Cytochrome P450 n=1 Tax=Westerdykella ornata TaxID=318751 RepID=A0A6A6JG53_WESOR|nr:cytochrome P450 [Westerdykella ornata]KAF2275245.1 cytochrome P450 [Westerdykella ornata]
MLQALVLLVAAWVVAVALYGIYNVTLHPLRSYPGPLLWRAYRLPATLSLLKGRFPFDKLELHKRYGPVVRVGPWELSYTSSAALKTIYGHHNPAVTGYSEFDKDRIEFLTSANGVWNVLSAYAEDHSRFRRLLSHSFSDKGLKEMQPRIQALIELLVKRLKEAADRGEYTNIAEWFNWTTFDVIGDLAFGSSFGCLEKQRTDPWIAAIGGNVKSFPVIAAIKRYHLTAILPYLVPKKLAKFRAENLRRNEAQIEARIEQGTERGDFWDKVIEKSDFEKGTGMTKPEMVANAPALVLAGSETTATLLSGTTYLLLKHPEVFKRLKQEVRASFKDESEIDLQSVSKLEYMLAVLDESMRIYTPVPKQGNRIVPKGGVMMAGQWVPGGTSVEVSQYATSLSETNFRNPNSFVPDRWLNPPPTEYADDDRAARATFSLGPRNCIGRNLAYAEMRLILAKICFNFDMELDEERCGDWIGDQKIFGLWEKGPLWMRLKRA